MIKNKTHLIRKAGLLALIMSTAFLSGCTTWWCASQYTPTSSYAQARAQFTHKNYVQAMHLLRPYAERGNAEAQYAVGYMYYYGQGVAVNKKLGISWMREAASFDNAAARQALLTINHAELAAHR